jgi:hypothetical protein
VDENIIPAVIAPDETETALGSLRGAKPSGTEVPVWGTSWWMAALFAQTV